MNLPPPPSRCARWKPDVRPRPERRDAGRNPIKRGIVVLLLLLLTATMEPAPVAAAEDAAPSDRQTEEGSSGLIADTETRHVLTSGGRELEYVARAGTLTIPEAGEEGARGRMFYVAYTTEAAAAERPITFVFNGGPGAAAAYLHLGAMGPRRIEFGEGGRIAPDPGPLVENDETWLTFTDLVFIDPIGTGYSRSIGPEDEKREQTSKGDASAFWETEKDLDTLGAFIRLYLSRNERWLSPTVLAGESYGGFRVAALADRLHSDFGISVEGIVMISPALELGLLSSDRFRLLPWITRVPSFAAAAHHHGRAGPKHGGEADRQPFLEEVERFTIRDLLPGLAEGRSLAESERSALLGRLAGFVGLPPELVVRHEGKLSLETFAGRLLRDESRIVSLYDASISYPAPHGDRYRDPRLSRISAAIVAGFNHYVRADLGIETDLPYEILNRRVNQGWQWRDGSSRSGPPGATDNLENAFKQNDHLRALLVHGLYDLVTPYYASTYLLNQLDLPPALRERIAVRRYEGGHMFYSRDGSRRAFRDDGMRLYGELKRGDR